MKHEIYSTSFKTIFLCLILVLSIKADFETTDVEVKDENIKKGCYWQYEKYDTCFGGCAEISCDNPSHLRRPCYPYCEPGCICEPPFVRDDRTHQCVLLSECSVGPKGIPQDRRGEKQTFWRYVTYNGISDRAKSLDHITDEDYYFDENEGSYNNYANKRRRMTFKRDGSNSTAEKDNIYEEELSNLNKFKNKNVNGIARKMSKSKLKRIYKMMNRIKNKLHVIGDSDNLDGSSTALVAVGKLQTESILQDSHEDSDSNEVIDLEKTFWNSLISKSAQDGPNSTIYQEKRSLISDHGYTTTAPYRLHTRSSKWFMNSMQTETSLPLKRYKRYIYMRRTCLNSNCNCDCNRCLLTSTCCCNCCRHRSMRHQYPTTSTQRYFTSEDECIPSTCPPYNCVESTCPPTTTTTTIFTTSTTRFTTRTTQRTTSTTTRRTTSTTTRRTTSTTTSRTKSTRGVFISTPGADSQLGENDMDAQQQQQQELEQQQQQQQQLEQQQQQQQELEEQQQQQQQLAQQQQQQQELEQQLQQQQELEQQQQQQLQQQQQHELTNTQMTSCKTAQYESEDMYVLSIKKVKKQNKNANVFHEDDFSMRRSIADIKNLKKKKRKRKKHQPVFMLMDNYDNF